MAERALDEALADLVEAFGHDSEAEIQAFLDATPALAGSDLRSAAPGLLIAPDFGPREFATGMPAGRVQAARA